MPLVACRAAKDMRASSVDFTFSRSSYEVNPPLPPPQEPLHRLRARSFSYSAAYGSPGMNPPPAPYPKQYGPPMGQQPHLQQPPLGQEFPHTLRGFHAGPRGQPQPPAGVRPPRVSIPTDSPMTQFQVCMRWMMIVWMYHLVDAEPCGC